MEIVASGRFVRDSHGRGIRIAVPDILGAIALGIVLAIGALGISFLFHPPLFDWQVFWQTPLGDPYSRYGFLNPFWLKWIIAPLHLTTEDFRLSWGLWSMITIMALMLILNDNKFALALAIGSPYFLHLILNGQVDIVVLVGYWLLQKDSAWGIPFLLTKPQSMIGSAITWGTRTSKKNLVIAFVVIGSMVLVGFLLYGNWIEQMWSNIKTDLYQPINIASTFHYPIIGIALFLIGLWRGNLFLSGLATLLITPYLAMHSLFVYWTAWLMERPNKWLVIVLATANWYIALRFTI